MHIENMAYWCDKETFKLIELWGEDKIQAQLEGCKRYKEVFVAISRKMEEAGYQKSASDSMPRQDQEAEKSIPSN